MKIRAAYLLALCTGGALLAGCATGGARPPVNTVKYNVETTSKFALMDDRAQRSVTCTGLQERKTEDGRLEIAANLRNRENRRIEVQAQCLFKDPQGFSVDESPWQTVILTENGQDTLRFTAMNNKAADYEVRVRSSR
jgi:Protein of unknown function (DUF1425)